MRWNNRSASDSESRPSSLCAVARTSFARADISELPFAIACIARRTRSNASSRVRRSPCISAAAAAASGAWEGADATAAAGTSDVAACGATASPGADSSPSAGAAVGAAAASRRGSRSRPRPPRRPRPRSSRGPRASRAGGVTAPAAGATAAAASSGRPTSSWPFSSLVSLSKPREAASCTKRENLGWPRSFSSKLESSSCITCLSRSERMTSPFRFMRVSASLTSSHGSFRTPSSSFVLTRPASAL